MHYGLVRAAGLASPDKLLRPQIQDAKEQCLWAGERRSPYLLAFTPSLGKTKRFNVNSIFFMSVGHKRMMSKRIKVNQSSFTHVYVYRHIAYHVI